MTAVIATTRYIRRNFGEGVENSVTLLSKWLVLLKKNALKILVRVRRKFGLCIEAESRAYFEARLVHATVEGNRVSVNFEVASQLFSNFFNALLEHRSLFPGWRPRYGATTLCHSAQNCPRATRFPVSSVLKTQLTVIVSSSLSGTTANFNFNSLVAQKGDLDLLPRLGRRHIPRGLLR